MPPRDVTPTNTCPATARGAAPGRMVQGGSGVSGSIDGAGGLSQITRKNKKKSEKKDVSWALAFERIGSRRALAGGTAGSDEAMVSLDDFIRAFKGPKVLPLPSEIARQLKPVHASKYELEQTALIATAGCPDNLLPADKLCPFLLDVYDSRLRVRCAVLDIVGSYYMLPHLHRVERHRPSQRTTLSVSTFRY